MQRHLPIFGLLAATLLATAAGAAGDIPGSPATRATLKVTTEATRGSFELDGDSDWYKVRLQKGQDYVVRFASPNFGAPASAVLRDARRRPLGETFQNSYGDSGFEYRAAASGTYFVDAKGEWDPDSPGARAYFVAVTFDCRDAASTKCVLEPGKARDGTAAHVGDWDRFAVTLDASKRYDFVVTATSGGGYCYEQLLDAAGTELAESEGFPATARIDGFRPARSGKHYLRVDCEVGEDYGSRYRVSVAER